MEMSTDWNGNKKSQIDIISTKFGKCGRTNKLQDQTSKMGLVRELGEAFKDANNIGDILKTWKLIVVGHFLGPELISGPLHRWKMIVRPLGSLWNTSRGLKPKKYQTKIKISKFPRTIFHIKLPYPTVCTLNSGWAASGRPSTVVDWIIPFWGLGRRQA